MFFDDMGVVLLHDQRGENLASRGVKDVGITRTSHIFATSI
jgi:hypothetical protein